MEFPSEEKVERLAHLLNGKFGVEVQFLGLPAPPLELLAKLCLQCHEWLTSGPDKMIVAHCFTGYLRSIVFAACFLSWQGQYEHPVDALDMICGSVDVLEEKILPSQKRYLTYFSAVMHGDVLAPLPVELSIKALHLHGTPDIPDFRPYVEVWQEGQRIFSSEQEQIPVVYSDTPASFP